jgi:hypothetical protein
VKTWAKRRVPPQRPRARALRAATASASRPPEDACARPRSYKHPYPENLAREKEAAEFKAAKEQRRARRAAKLAGEPVRAAFAHSSRAPSRCR